MVTLNAGAAQAMRELGSAVHAATDVTGFGMLGHLRNMLEASNVQARISAGRVPLFAGVRDLIERDAVPGGTVRNLDSVKDLTRWASDLTRVDQLVLADAQTSGGLLIAVDSSRAEDLRAALERYETPARAIIGEVVGDGDKLIEVRS
jgi:selenide,water dikinase